MLVLALDDVQCNGDSTSIIAYKINAHHYVSQSAKCISLNLLCIPVAWAISDREDSETIEAMFTVVKEKCPDAKVSTLMTDDGIKLYVFVYNFYATFISN